MSNRTAAVLALAGVFIISGIATALAMQGRPDPAALLAAQRDAMKQFAFMDGEWRGEAWTILPTGEKHQLTQTERIGPFLDGAVKVIEGRGYEKDGTVGFNALGIISFNPGKNEFSMRSYAMGYAGDYVMKPTTEGFTWEIPAGPMTMRYTATVKDGTWHEVGDRVVGDQKPVRFFEMTLKRLGDSAWPGAGAVQPGT